MSVEGEKPVPPEPATGIAERASIVFDRHERNRQEGIACVSVLLGSPSLARSVWTRWSETQDRRTWEQRYPPGPDLIQEAQARLFGTPGARQCILEQVAAACGEHDPTAFRERFARMTPHECGMLWEHARRKGLDERLIGLAPHVLEGAGQHAECLETALSQDRPPLHALFVAAYELIPRAKLPTLLVTLGDKMQREPGHVREAMEWLAGLAEACPGATLAIALAPERFDAYIAKAPESRAKALCRASAFRLPGSPPSGLLERITQHVADPAAREAIGESLRYLESMHPPREVYDAFESAVTQTCTTRRAPAGAPDSAARSATEAFLYQCLEAMPATAGLFELNGKLPIAFNPWSQMEVDLLCRPLKLAVEIDGYYHFREADNYRRDRRKDYLLQRHGYLVVRALAEDVVTRLPDVLGSILDAVALRRQE